MQLTVLPRATSIPMLPTCRLGRPTLLQMPVTALKAARVHPIPAIPVRRSHHTLPIPTLGQALIQHLILTRKTRHPVRMVEPTHLERRQMLDQVRRSLMTETSLCKQRPITHTLRPSRLTARIQMLPRVPTSLLTRSASLRTSQRTATISQPLCLTLRSTSSGQRQWCLPWQCVALAMS